MTNSGARLILASQSAARQMLLRNAGLAFDAIPAEIDERALQAQSGHRRPGDIAAHLACAKARHVSAQHPDRYVIGADQTLALRANPNGTDADDDRLFNKPDGRDGAAAQLQALQGRTHELHSAICVAKGDAEVFAHLAVARMTMRPLDAHQIAAYLDAAGDAVTRSVGAYQLEGLGVHLFDHIDGDHFTILGLPLLPLLAFLRSEGVLQW
jgi:septum formation protein